MCEPVVQAWTVCNDTLPTLLVAKVVCEGSPRISRTADYWPVCGRRWVPYRRFPERQ